MNVTGSDGLTAEDKKLVHVTAWPLFHRDDEDEYAAFRVILFQSGARYGLDAYNTIRDYLSKPKP